MISECFLSVLLAMLNGSLASICLRFGLIWHLAGALTGAGMGLGLGAGVAAMRCKAPYEKVQENYCYHIDDTEPLPTSFSNFCYGEKRTSRVCLESAEEMHVLANYLYGIGFQNGTQFWSAAHRWPGDMRFYWNHFGRARAMNYTNWLDEEPTPRMGLNCVLLTLQAGQLFMSSASCHAQAVDICEQLLVNEPTIMH